MDRQRPHRDDEASDERQARAPRPIEAGGADTAILDLQATAGNRAVTELLAPSTGDVAVQRETTDELADCRAHRHDRVGHSHHVDPGPQALRARSQSIQMGAQRAGRGGTGNSSREQATSGEVAATFGADNLSPALFAAAAQGQQFGVVTITLGASTLTLHGVVISSAKRSGDSASVSLNFTSRELTSGGGGG